MKRCLGWLLSVSLVLSGIIPVSADNEYTTDGLSQGETVTELINYDFEGFADTKPSRLGISSNSGVITADTVEDVYGTSLKMGSDIAMPGAGGAGNPLIQVDCQPEEGVATKSLATMEADFYMENREAELWLTTRGISTAEEMRLVKFRFNTGDSQKANIYVQGSGGKIDWTNSLNDFFREQRWYHLKYTIDGKTQVMNIWLTDKETGETVRLAEDVTAQGTAPNGYTQLRMTAGMEGKGAGYLYIDNMYTSLTSVFAQPVKVTAVRDGEEQEDKIPYDAQQLKIYMSGGVKADTVTKENIILSNENEVVPCEAISYDSGAAAILFTPAQALKSSTEYTFTISKNVVMEDGSAPEADQTIFFTTANQPFDVIRGGFTQDSKTAAFHAAVSNETDEDKTLTAIISVYSDGQFVEAKAVTQTIPAGTSEQILKTPPAQFPAGARAEGYVWEGIVNAKSVASVVYTYTAPSLRTADVTYLDDSGSLELSGSCEPGTGVTMLMIPSDLEYTSITAEQINENAAVVKTMFAGTDGSYNETLKISSKFPEGNYTVYTSENGETAQEFPFDFIKPSGKIQITSPVSGTYSKEKITEVMYEASNYSNMFQKAELYIDNVLAGTSTEEMGSFPIESLSGGRHVFLIKAYAQDGKIAEDQVEVNIADSAVKMLLDTDLNEYTSGNPAGLDCGSVASNGGYIEPVKIDDAHGQSLKLTANPSNEAKSPFVGIPVGDTTDILTVEAEIYFPENPGAFTPTVRNQANWNSLTLANFRPAKDHELYIPSSKAGDQAISYAKKFEDKTWYPVKFVIDGSDMTYEMWFNGEKVVQKRYANNHENVTVLNMVRFNTATDPVIEQNIILDNIKAYITVNYPAIASIGSVKDGVFYNEVLYDAEKVAIHMTGAVKPESAAKNIGLSNAFGDVGIDAAEISEDGKIILLTPSDMLRANAAYTVTLKKGLQTVGGDEIGYEQVQHFQTTVKPLDVITGEFQKSSNKITFAPTVTNQTGTEQTVMSVITVWKGQELIDVKAAEQTIAPGTQRTVKTDWAEYETDAYAKGFVLNKENSVSISQNEYEYGRKPEQEKQKNTGYTADGGILTVAGTADTKFQNTAVYVLPDAMAPEMVTADQINKGNIFVLSFFAGEDKTYSMKAGLGGYMSGGKYTMYALSGGQIKETYSFFHVNPQLAQGIISQINAAQSSAELGAVASVNLGVLGVDEAQYQDNPDYINTILFKRRPANGYTAVSFYQTAYEAITANRIRSGQDTKKVLKDYATILGIDYQEEVAAVSGAVWNYAETYLKKQDYTEKLLKDALWEGSLLGKINAAQRQDNIKVLFLEDDDTLTDDAKRLGIDLDKSGASYHEVKTKSSVWKKYIEKKNKKSPQTIEDAVKMFYDSVQDVLKEEADGEKDKRPGSGNSGGGGGSGGANNSGSGSLITNDNSISGQLDEIGKELSKSKYFSDMTAHWALDTVDALTEKKIISGFGDGTFRPDESVTRAQFCEMIVKALGLSQTADGKSFADVSENDWFAAAVNTASQNEIVQGADGYFRPGENITRQDAAVMVYRAVKNQGKNLFGMKEFADQEQIYEYAKEAVAMLGAAGLVNGIEDSFVPLKNTTRAEAATMVYNLITYLEH